MFDTTEKLRQYLTDIGLDPLHIDQEEDGSLSAYFQSRRSLAKAFNHFVELDCIVTARHRPNKKGAHRHLEPKLVTYVTSFGNLNSNNVDTRYHLNVSPPHANLIIVDVFIYLN